MEYAEVLKRGFSIGEHSCSRSLFGLRKSQVIGESASVILAFAALLSIGSLAGLLTFALVVTFASAAFLAGYKGTTLDKMILALLAQANGGLVQGRYRYRHDLHGFSMDPNRSLFIASSHSWGSRRISNSRKRSPIGVRSRFGGVELRSLREVRLDGGSTLGVARERRGAKRSVLAYELFGEGFLLCDRQDQLSVATIFGTMLGNLGSLGNSVESIVLLYLIDPGRAGDVGASTFGWAEDVRTLYNEVHDKAVSRRCYLIIRMEDVGISERDYFELDSFVSNLGLRYKALGGSSLAELFAFGTGERSEREVLHMRSKWGHLLVGERLMKLFDVTELPTGEIGPDFLVPFVTSLECESLLSFRLKAIESHLALKKVRARRSGITADAGIRALLGFLARNSETRAISSLELQENDLDMGYEMFSVAGHFALFADSLYELKDVAQAAVAKAEKSGLLLECAYGRQLQARRQLFGSPR